ncbi:MAG: YitT family protein, partial [Thermoplasmatales archaeon]|nr:YitT family protein [Thermoplasmatales archaeon]
MKILYIIIGCIICALSYAVFLIPHQIVPGGVTGIAMLLHFLYHTPVGLAAIILNIPLFIIAIRILGVSYGIKSVIAIFITNLLIDFLVYTIKIPTPTNNTVLAALYGG